MRGLAVPRVLVLIAPLLGGCVYDPYSGTYVPCCSYYGYPYYRYPYYPSYRYPPPYYPPYGGYSAPQAQPGGPYSPPPHPPPPRSPPPPGQPPPEQLVPQQLAPEPHGPTPGAALVPAEVGASARRFG
jgi:hypothetical protein